MVNLLDLRIYQISYTSCFFIDTTGIIVLKFIIVQLSAIRWKMTPLKFSCLGHQIFPIRLTRFLLKRFATYEAQVHDAENCHSFNTTLQHNLKQFNQCAIFSICTKQGVIIMLAVTKVEWQGHFT
jgi:hypothetical protein